MMAGELLKEISDLVKPRIAGSDSAQSEKGKIVIGTVRGISIILGRI
jgi:methanogenic corrinoid protein MtbC1